MVVLRSFPILLVLSQAISALRPPEQIHLAQGISFSEMTVQWITATDPVMGSGLSTVEYGLLPTTLNISGQGRNITYPVPQGWEESGDFIHAIIARNLSVHLATMTGLQRNTTYYYRVGDEIDGWSDVYDFHILAKDVPFRVAIVADMDSDTSVAETIACLQNDLLRRELDAVIHPGDLAYDMCTANGTYADRFMQAMQPLAAHVPYMLSPGNHEFNFNFTDYLHRFAGVGTNSPPIPQDAGSNVGGLPNSWFYSFNMGPVHFISVDTEMYLDVVDVTFSSRYGWDYPDMTAWQYEWLEADLAAVNRSSHPWIIVFTHRPMYCSNGGSVCTQEACLVREGIAPNRTYPSCPLPSHISRHQQDQYQYEYQDQDQYQDQRFLSHSLIPQIQKSSNQDIHLTATPKNINENSKGKVSEGKYGLEALLSKYEVDVYVCGHSHSYERFAPVMGGEPDWASVSEDFATITRPRFPVHIVSGSGGNKEGQTPFEDDTIAFSLVRSLTISYTALTVHNHTHLEWNQMCSDVVVGCVGQPIDTWWLTK